MNWPALLILLIIFFTVGGNILVILAVSLERKLQNATNFFLRSLAVADMLVGILVMPASLISILYDYAWPLPRSLCPMWIFLDVLFSTASIMHLCAISLDRYIGIRSPIKYSQTNTSFLAITKIGAVWTISVVLSLPIPIIGLQDEQKVFVNGSCVLNEPRFILIGSFVAFFIPLVIMVVCYYLTLRVLQQHVAIFLRDHKMHKPPDSSSQPSVSSSSLLKHDSSSAVRPNRPRDENLRGGPVTGSHNYTGQRSQGHRGMAQALKNERRASKVLGVVFFLFLIMWCPFFITNVLIAVCRGECDNHLLAKLMNVFVWVGYVSSGVNPLVYTLFNRTYRHAFSRYLHCSYQGEPMKPQFKTACQVYAVTPALVLARKTGTDSNGNGLTGRDTADQGLRTEDDVAKGSIDSCPTPTDYTSSV
ncbi:5-hydroxytryptamine receptor 2C [Chanos chanos]|uniref:5-hydroxytryptamine receptor 2C n=1 Tax=Chanos chanos TaxID=29144 RepID=A0A6J2WXW8_CHACN|nr:5-hydroxytryptamine receptor 2C-like [Chanos chanos]